MCSWYHLVSIAYRSTYRDVSILMAAVTGIPVEIPCTSTSALCASVVQLVSRLTGDLQCCHAEEDLQPLIFPLLQLNPTPTPPAPRLIYAFVFLV